MIARRYRSWLIIFLIACPKQCFTGAFLFHRYFKMISNIKKIPPVKKITGGYLQVDIIHLSFIHHLADPTFRRQTFRRLDRVKRHKTYHVNRKPRAAPQPRPFTSPRKSHIGRPSRLTSIGSALKLYSMPICPPRPIFT